MTSPIAQVTEVLKAHAAGDPAAQAKLLSLIYDDLRALAAAKLRGERPDHTLQPTALVHEAYLRLVDLERMCWQDRNHFFAMAATTIRRVLVDHARAQRAKKRGGGAERVSLADGDGATLQDPVDLLALDEAIEKLKAAHPRQASVVDLRFFAGLSVAETAHALDIGPETVKDDWQFARAWLNRELTRGGASE